MGMGVKKVKVLTSIACTTPWVLASKFYVVSAVIASFLF